MVKAIYKEYPQQQHLNIVGTNWHQSNNSFECEGINNFCWLKEDVHGDFFIEIKMKIHKLDKSAASIAFGPNSNFGFSGGERVAFIEGPMFESNSAVHLSDVVFREGEKFTLTIQRKGLKVSFRLNGRKIMRGRFSSDNIGKIGLRPWRSQMFVYKFSYQTCAHVVTKGYLHTENSQIRGAPWKQEGEWLVGEGPHNLLVFKEPLRSGFKVKATLMIHKIEKSAVSLCFPNYDSNLGFRGINDQMFVEGKLFNTSQPISFNPGFTIQNGQKFQLVVSLEGNKFCVWIDDKKLFKTTINSNIPLEFSFRPMRAQLRIKSMKVVLL